MILNPDVGTVNGAIQNLHHPESLSEPIDVAVLEDGSEFGGRNTYLARGGGFEFVAKDRGRETGADTRREGLRIMRRTSRVGSIMPDFQTDNCRKHAPLPAPNLILRDSAAENGSGIQKSSSCGERASSNRDHASQGTAAPERKVGSR